MSAAPIAADASSNQALENHAVSLGNTTDIRNALRLAYSLGKCDGALAGVAEFSRRLAVNRELAKASA